MLIVLFIFDILLIILTVFTTHMVEHKFQAIQASLGAYCNKRTYKTKADIEFIETIISDYRRLCSDTDEEPDLPSAVSLKLHKEYIGKFTYVAVKNIAIKARHLMWGILVTEVLVTCINKTTQEGQSLLILLTSLLLTVMTCFYGIIKGIDEKQETLIDEVTHYVRNVYPLELKKQQNVSKQETIEENDKVDEEVAGLSEKEENLKEHERFSEKTDLVVDEKKNLQNEQIKNVQQGRLSANDIARFLENL